MLNIFVKLWNVAYGSLKIQEREHQSSMPAMSQLHVEKQTVIPQCNHISFKSTLESVKSGYLHIQDDQAIQAETLLFLIMYAC